jgi:hypothetical protein
MSYLATALSIILIVVVLWDAFEVMLLPRRIRRSLRFARLFYINSWKPWKGVARRIRSVKLRNAFLSYFGPLSILILIGAWAIGLILGFALLQWSLDTELHTPGEEANFSEYLYLSGVTFFTLGFGDVTPVNPLGRLLTVTETGLGFGFLAVLISYLPVQYQAFSHREVTIALLDARAGSPPTAAQILIRIARHRNFNVLDRFLEEWERWAAEVLESHVSFPVLSFYRSQHDNQSWLAAITAMLDTATLVIVAVNEVEPYQAQLTFATARHTVVDLAMVFQIAPSEPEADRLPPGHLRRLRDELASAGVTLREGEAVDRKLAELRGMYEPFVNGLARYFLFPLPPYISDTTPVDNWQTSAWMQRTGGIDRLPPGDRDDEHLI